jgi:hypothetical protein
MTAKRWIIRARFCSALNACNLQLSECKFGKLTNNAWQSVAIMSKDPCWFLDSDILPEAKNSSIASTASFLHS